MTLRNMLSCPSLFAFEFSHISILLVDLEECILYVFNNASGLDKWVHVPEMKSYRLEPAMPLQ
jgi:hypothetical protein